MTLAPRDPEGGGGGAGTSTSPFQRRCLLGRFIGHEGQGLRGPYHLSRLNEEGDARIATFQYNPMKALQASMMFTSASSGSSWWALKMKVLLPER